MASIVMRKIKNIYHWVRSWFWVFYYGYPAKELTVIGVTGTDGKTTTCNLIYEILRAAGYKAGLISTVWAKIDGKEFSLRLHVTNPEASILQKLLRQMVDEGCTHVVLEVTSHGLDQNRVVGCNFKIGVLTNITHEHFDYHKTMEEYVAAKAKLFRKVEYALLPNSQISSNSQIIKYSKTRIKNINPSLAGEYNKYNIGAAEAVAKILGGNQRTVNQFIRYFAGAPGRREEIKMGQKFRCIVDFAHTPNALEQLLVSLRRETKNKIILIFGCTGERDKEKRPVMGEIADRYADEVVVTTDDVRSESQDEIYEQIVNGMRRKPYREDDRDRAIEMGVKMARAGDIVVASGMGHEQTQLIGKTEVHRSDKMAFANALKT